MAIRKVPIEESMEVQRDHARRCKENVENGTSNPEALERISYTEVSRLIPEYVKPFVLDLGCQNLEAHKYLKAVMPDMWYVGLEILPELVEEMSKRYPDRVIVQGYAEKMPFDNKVFDVVWARHVLEHSTDIHKVLRECRRVLKPNGVIAFTVPTGVHNEPAHFLEITREEWREIFVRNRFTVCGEGQHDFNCDEYYGILML